MNDRNLENKIKAAVENTTPDVLDRILAGCEAQKGNVIQMTQLTQNPSNHKKKTRMFTMIAFAAAIVVVLAGWLAGPRLAALFQSGNSIVAIDVNPSIQLTVNDSEKVVEATALNADAEGILDGMELKNTDLNVAVNALIGSMVKNGYIDQLANSVLVSVESSDAAKGAALNEKIVSEIDQLLQSSAIQGAVVGQTLTEDDELRQLAETYQISTGKAALIQEILAKKPLLTFENLAGLSINELNLLNSTGDQGQDTTAQTQQISTGTPSDGAYIGEDKAKEAAFTHAGVAESDASYLKVEMDWDHGRMVYDVEFVAGGMEYDYEIDATTGQVVQSDWEMEKDGYSSSSSSADAITLAQAKELAFQAAGVTEDQVYGLDIDYDSDDGRSICQVEFRTDSAKYEYELDAATGQVLKSDIEQRGSGAGYGAGQGNGQGAGAGQSSGTAGQGTGNGAGDGTGGRIGQEEARDAALAHAGAPLSEVYDLKVELDNDDWRECVYEVEFDWNRTEYEYVIDAQTGEILSHKAEQD